MDQYFQQFKNLPRELKQSVSSEEKVIALEEIEKKYNLKLIKVIVRIMIKDISWQEVEQFCQENFNLSIENARALKKELADKIFNEVMGYLQKIEGGEKTEDLIEGQQQKFKKQQIEIGDIKTEEKDKPLVAVKKTLNLQPPPIIKKDVFQLTKVEFDRQKIKEDFNKIKTTLNQNFSQDDLIKKIIDQLNLYFEEDNLVKRFSNIIKNYLRDIRTEAQTEELLQHPKKTNGLEMGVEQAVLIVKIAQEFKKQKTLSTKKYFVERETAKKNIEEPSFINNQLFSSPLANQPVELTSQTLTEKKLSQAEKKIDPAVKKRFEDGTIVPFFQKIIQPLSIQSPSPNIYKNNQRFNQVEEDGKKGFSISIKKKSENSNLVQDVSSSPLRAVGPVEELSEITLDDLKHWGGGQKTFKIIFDKINLLGEISLLKKSEAIRAWQKSQLYSFYLELGRAALANEMSISEIINQRQEKNLPFMNKEDFEAIGELNKRLRF